MILNKLKYGMIRLWAELFNDEDYWKLVYPARIQKNENFTFYYLDISKKGIYPFMFEHGIPITMVNGNREKNPATILNYGLGLIDLHYFGSDKIKEIKTVMNWAISNQSVEGAWQLFRRENKDKSELSTYSGLSQGLAVSFLFRCMKLNILDKNEGEKIISKAIQFMTSDKIVNSTVEGEIIEEYPHQKTGVLNGFIFALIALWDYGIFYNDFSLFNKYELTLRKNLKKYNFFGWSYYDLKKMIATKFYHKLDIEMLKWMFYITNEPTYKKYSRIWKIGLYFYPIFVFIVAIQRLIRLEQIDVMEINN